jgi:hypothetical protein
MPKVHAFFWRVCILRLICGDCLAWRQTGAKDLQSIRACPHRNSYGAVMQDLHTDLAFTQ